MLLALDATPAFVNEMERRLRLNEDILRLLTLRVKDIEERPIGDPIPQNRRA